MILDEKYLNINHPTEPPDIPKKYITIQSEERSFLHAENKRRLSNQADFFLPAPDIDTIIS